MMCYDYLIVGAGLYIAVSAREMKDAEKKVLVNDKRLHIEGNMYTEDVEGVLLQPETGHQLRVHAGAVQGHDHICLPGDRLSLRLDR